MLLDLHQDLHQALQKDLHNDLHQDLVQDLNHDLEQDLGLTELGIARPYTIMFALQDLDQDQYH